MSVALELNKEIKLDELKVIQMDILKAIDEYCGINNIRYSMACGTLLGAVRHKGYIPWDDDVDIYVLREDYRKLIKEFPALYQGRYEIISLERSKKWNRPYAKAYDDRTIMIEKIVNNEIIGVNIDIFPIDDVPDDDNEWDNYNKRRRKSQKAFALKFVKLNKGRSLKKNIILLLFKIFTSFYSARRWAEKLDRKAQENNNKGYKRCFECCQGLLQKQPFPKELFDEIIEIPFENRSFKAFAKADEYLRNGFGDYMQLPPEEKRVTHHVFKAYWKS